MERKDYYKTLGVDHRASPKEIKNAYRKLAQRYHPDVNPGDEEAENRFKELGEAYQVLSDPDRRRVYDLGEGNWGQGGSWSSWADPYSQSYSWGSS
jgi:DnaJ-class molecular chaperone